MVAMCYHCLTKSSIPLRTSRTSVSEASYSVSRRSPAHCQITRSVAPGESARTSWTSSVSHLCRPGRTWRCASRHRWDRTNSARDCIFGLGQAHFRACSDDREAPAPSTSAHIWTLLLSTGSLNSKYMFYILSRSTGQGMKKRCRSLGSFNDFVVLVGILCSRCGQLHDLPAGRRIQLNVAERRDIHSVVWVCVCLHSTHGKSVSPVLRTVHVAVALSSLWQCASQCER